MTPDLSKIFLNDGSEDKQQLTIDKMATNEFIKTKAIDNAKRNAKEVGRLTAICFYYIWWFGHCYIFT